MALRLRNCPVIIYACNTNKKHAITTISCGRKHHLSHDVSFRHEKDLIKDKMGEMVKWYDELTGINDIRKAQNRVLEEEQNFRKAQETRRNILVQLNEIQSKIKEVYAEMDTTNRSEDRYIHLVTMENKLLKEEKSVLEKFSQAEKNERDAFTTLSSSVKFSHEKERTQRERTKYWSVIGSVVGTLFGIIGTSINNHFKMKELKELIKNSSDVQLMTMLKGVVEKNDMFLKQMNNSSPNNESETLTSVGNENSAKKIEQLLKQINYQLHTVEDKLNKVELIGKRDDSPVLLTGDETSDVVELTQAVHKQYLYTKVFLLGLSVLSLVMPVITKYYF